MDTALAPPTIDAYIIICIYTLDTRDRGTNDPLPNMLNFGICCIAYVRHIYMCMTNRDIDVHLDHTYLPLMVGTCRVCLVEFWSFVLVKTNNEKRYTKWTSTVTLSVALRVRTR